MKILQLCKKFPYPLKDGESVAVTYLASALHGLGASLTLLAMNTTKHYFNPKDLPSDFNHYAAIHLVPLDNRVRAIGALRNLLFSRQSYHVTRYINQAFEQQLVRLLHQEQFDVVHLETLYLAPYIPIIRQHSDARIVMRAHNVEFEIWERITANTAWGLKRAYLKLLTQRLRRFEIQQLREYDLLVAITARDLERFRRLGYQGTAHVTPVGLRMEDYPSTTPLSVHPFSVGFIGSLDWMPNLEGLSWFIESAWKPFVAKHPDVQLHIAGRNTPDWIYKKDWPNVQIHGEVPSAQAFIQAHTVMLVPLLSGSGMRVKILETMALGRINLTTSIGLEGIPAQDGQEVFVADDAASFVQRLNYCYEHAQTLPTIGAAARAFVQQTYDYRVVAQQLLEQLEMSN